MLDIKKTSAKMLQIVEPRAPIDSGVMTSPYTVRIQSAVVRSGICSLSLAVNNGGSNFPNGRISTLATLSEDYRPPMLIIAKATASNGINSYANRTASILIQPSGNIIVDNHGNTDVKEIHTSITYAVGGVVNRLFNTLKMLTSERRWVVC